MVVARVGYETARRGQTDLVVNDVHSQLNRTRVAEIVRPRCLEDLQATIARARSQRRGVSVAGGRHAMGGQQFATSSLLIDTRGMDRVLGFDRRLGLVSVEAGIQWPALIAYLNGVQEDSSPQWGIAQKQTGADRLSLGGALAANVHGRGLTLPPLVGQIDSFVLVDADGRSHRCSRTENGDLFRLAIGGYGLFGILYAVTLRLTRRRKLQRVVEVRTIEGLMERFDRRIADGFIYGDFQVAIDRASSDLLRKGIFCCYRPVNDDVRIPAGQRALSRADWERLLYLAHCEKARAFELYARHYMSTDGQIYWSDTHQLAEYVDDYHAALDRVAGSVCRGTEMITELYVPPPALESFLDEVRAGVRRRDIDLIYGTIRLIEPDADTFLAWARQPWACVVLNLHVTHTRDGVARAAAAFRYLIDVALAHGGSYYLTYHRWATREHVTRAYPQFEQFLHLKQRYDPCGVFQSNWYAHHKQMFSTEGRSGRTRGAELI